MTYIVAKPLQLLLDRVIKHNEAQPHSRDGIWLIVGDHLGPSTELDNYEVEIIQGALQLSEKRVGEIMQPIEGVFLLPNTAVLDEKTVDLITEKGFSRVPVFDKNLTRCYGVLLMKDMVNIDFDEEPQPILTFDLHETKK